MKDTREPIDIKRIESALDHVRTGLRGDETERIAKELYEKGVRFHG